MIKRNLPAIILLAALAILWEAGVTAFHVPHFIIPKLSRVFAAMWELRDVLAKHFVVTLEESVIGLVISVAFGVAAAVWIHFSGVARKAVYPLIIASQTIPMLALSPVMVMWFGYEIWSKIAVIVLFTFFSVTVNTIDGLRSVDPDMHDLMRTMGARRRDIFRKLHVPSALPAFFTGFKIAATYSVVGATTGEWLGAESGLGMFSRRASNMMRADSVFAAVFLLSAMGLLLFLTAKGLEYIFVGRHNRSTR
jgi:putative hydroxymethylpyrimidine transport system permease protein